MTEQITFPRDPAHLHRAETWIFDLDNTLYPAECALFAQMERRMGEFVAAHLNLTLETAKLRQKAFFEAHGTTLRGLMVEHGIDPGAYLEYVHDIDLSGVPPSPNLRRSLRALPGRKLIFTNGTAPHAERVLDRLGLSDCFEAVFDIVASEYLPKPNPAPYHKLLNLHDINPRTAVMVEDMARNLVPAAALGMATVWIPTAAAWSQPANGDPAHVHHTVQDIARFLGDVAAAANRPAGDGTAG